MSLQLIKIEEGLCTGEVLFHEYGSYLFMSHFFFPNFLVFVYTAKINNLFQISTTCEH